MLQWIIRLLGLPLLEKIVEGYKARLQHMSQQDVLAVDLAKAELVAEIEANKSAKEVIIAEQGRWYTAIIRPLGMLPFIVFLWKVVVWDKVLGWGTTDALDPNLWSLLMVMAGSYYGGRSLEKVAQVFRKR